MTSRTLALILGCIAFALTSCKEVSFPVPQPRSVQPISEIPRALHGRYMAATPPDEKKDTLIIEPWGYHFKDSRDKDWLGKGVISDSLVIKQYNDYFFVNFRIDTGRWVLRVVKQQPSGSLEFLSLNVQDEQTEIELISKLSKTIEVKKVDANGDTFYEIDPTRDQLMSFLASGYFTGGVLERKK
jgi:hypothetical protein